MQAGAPSSCGIQIRAGRPHPAAGLFCHAHPTYRGGLTVPSDPHPGTSRSRGSAGGRRTDRSARSTTGSGTGSRMQRGPDRSPTRQALARALEGVSLSDRRAFKLRSTPRRSTASTTAIGHRKVYRVGGRGASPRVRFRVSVTTTIAATYKCSFYAFYKLLKQRDLGTR